ncbi:MAG: hypothetical protein U1F15_15140 [Burkholderiales bacterium]
MVVTRVTDRAGSVVEITDGAPRFEHHGRLHQPMTILRRIRRLAGSPRAIVRLRPAFRYGRARPAITAGSHRLRYVGPDLTLRLTTDPSLAAILEERAFVEANCWNVERSTFVAAAGEQALDASLLLLAELNFPPATDPRFVATVDALAAVGRREEARALFARLLGRRNRHGLRAGDLHPVTGELCGNIVQT